MTMQKIKSYLLFTTPFCTTCKGVKEFLKNVSLKGSHVDASDDQGSEIAVKYNVQGVPTIVFLDENNNEVTRAFNVGTIRSILE